MKFQIGDKVKFVIEKLDMSERESAPHSTLVVTGIELDRLHNKAEYRVEMEHNFFDSWHVDENQIVKEVVKQ